MSSRAERKMNRYLGLTSRDNPNAECYFCKQKLKGRPETYQHKGMLIVACNECSELVKFL
jgi:hypothetical protein